MNMKRLDNTYQDASLIRKALLQEMSEEEELMLEKRLSENLELKTIYEQLQNGKELKEQFEGYQKYSSKKAYYDFIRHIEQKKKPEVRAMKLWWYAAAMVVLAIGISFFVMNQDGVKEEVEERTALINPGRQKAILMLPDGSVIDVQDQHMDVVVDGVQVKYQQGVLSYQPTAAKENEAKSADDRPIQSNELVIPRGAENTVLLADGTMVHLNAGSKLTYPVRFAGGRRIVALEGEAYFEVTKDAEHPFVVRTPFGEINVLGTSFNVNAYADAKICYTTLVSGKVSYTASSKETVTLLPGEQAVATGGRIEKRTVDVEEYIGWMKGVYTFNNRSLEEIMKTFERWYDVRVYYETPALRELTYSGNLKRYSTINTFLDALEITGDIYYRINGRNILIYENK